VKRFADVVLTKRRRKRLIALNVKLVSVTRTCFSIGFTHLPLSIPFPSMSLQWRGFDVNLLTYLLKLVN
jgi:hypothetical protein